jgi:hypothetical protein
LGCREDGSFALQVNKTDRPFDLLLSTEFLAKYNLNTETLAWSDPSPPEQEEEHVSTLRLTQIVDPDEDHPELYILRGSEPPQDPVFLDEANPNEYAVVNTHQVRTNYGTEARFETYQRGAFDATGDYYEFHGGNKEQIIHSPGHRNIDSLSEFVTLGIKAASPSFSPELGIASDNKVLYTLHIPNTYSIVSDEDLLKVCKVNFEVPGDVIVKATKHEWHQLNSSADLRHFQFYIFAVRRDGSHHDVYLPPDGRCSLKVMLMTLKG